MHKVFKPLFLLFLLTGSTLTFAQKDTTRAGDIDTQRLIIVKPYSPTVSDAVKTKQNPTSDEDAVLEREEVDYQIHSVPVASTFVPEKGRAATVQQSRRSDLYNSYAALGAGNYLNVFGEIYTKIELDDRHDMTLGLQHLSSQGGLKDLRYGKKDQFYDSKFDLGFNAEEDYFYWNLNLGLLHQLYNWYGAFDPTISSDLTRALKPNRNFTGAFVEADMNFKEIVFDKIGLYYHHFGDDFYSNEDHVILSPKLTFPVGDEDISIDLVADYLNGHFGRSLQTQKGYSWLNLGFKASYNYDYGDFSFNLGGQMYYSMDTKNSKNDLYFYPKVKASYNIAGDYFKLYGGVEGHLNQNTYYGFSQKNLYLAPDILVGPTNQQYDIFFGGKGKLTDELHYDLRGNYSSQKSKALFTAKPGSLTQTRQALTKYDQFDTFEILYDNIKTLSLYGGLEYKYEDDFLISAGATYSNYESDYYQHPWNLPELEAFFSTDIRLSKQWEVGGDVFFVGERKDFLDDVTDIVKIKPYFDANFRLNFRITEQFGLFANLNNLFNSQTPRWYGYEVQGLQFMFGLAIQF